MYRRSTSASFLTIPLFQAAVGRTEKLTVFLTLCSLCAHSGAASAAPIALSEWPQAHQETHALAKNRRCTTCLGAKGPANRGPQTATWGHAGGIPGWNVPGPDRMHQVRRPLWALLVIACRGESFEIPCRMSRWLGSAAVFWFGKPMEGGSGDNMRISGETSHMSATRPWLAVVADLSIS